MAIIVSYAEPVRDGKQTYSWVATAGTQEEIESAYWIVEYARKNWKGEYEFEWEYHIQRRALAYFSEEGVFDLRRDDWSLSIWTYRSDDAALMKLRLG